MKREGRGILLGGWVALGLVAAITLVAVGSSVDDEYQRRLAQVDTTKADDLVALALWCYQSDLKEQAVAHALQVLALDPGDTRAKYLIYAVQAENAAYDNGDDSTDTTSGPKLTITQKDADAVYAREGDAQMARFKNQIQGMLLLRCATPACHGGNKDAKYALLKRSLSDRRTLAQNFTTINAYISRENPEESKLLQKPLQGPDGGHPRRAISGTNDPTYRALLEWIKTLKSEGQQIDWNRSSPPPAE